jgi:hypothetical protein
MTPFFQVRIGPVGLSVFRLEAVSRHTLTLRALSRPLGRRVAQCLALPEQPWQPHTMASPSVHMFIARNPQAVGSMPKVPKAVLTVRGQICLAPGASLISNSSFLCANSPNRTRLAPPTPPPHTSLVLSRVCSHRVWLGLWVGGNGFDGSGSGRSARCSRWPRGA